MRNYVLVIQGFEGILAEAYSNSDKSTAAKVLTTIKGNPEIAKLYTIVNNLRKGDVNESTVDSYIKENIEFSKGINYKKIAFPIANEIKSDYDLHNDIGTILFEEKTAYNINRYNSAYNSVKENLLKAKTLETKTSEVAKKISEGLNQMDKEDKILVEKFIKTPEGEKVTIFESTKSECLKHISKHISDCEDVSSKIKMYEAKDAVLDMAFNEKSYISDMVKIHNLNKQLK
jgi:frataxin-like iron-binding protein CyaY